MKFYLLWALIGASALIFLGRLEAGEFTGAGKRAVAILESQSVSWQQLELSGHQLVASGEFTGGGKNLAISKIRYVVSKREAFEKGQIDQINFLKPAGATVRPSVEGLPRERVLSDVESLEASGQLLRLQDLEAIVIKK